MLIEKISGRDYFDYIREYIYQPAGMVMRPKGGQLGVREARFNYLRHATIIQLGSRNPRQVRPSRPARLGSAPQGARRVNSIPAALPVSVSIGGIPVLWDGQRWFTHHSFGRVVDLLAPRVNGVHYFGPEVHASASAASNYDYAFTGPNITVHPWGARRSTLEAPATPPAAHTRVLATHRQRRHRCFCAAALHLAGRPTGWHACAAVAWSTGWLETQSRSSAANNAATVQ